MLAVLKRAIATHGAPEYIRSDNGPVPRSECDDKAKRPFIARPIKRWLADNQIKTLYIDPGFPWQNGYVESFNSRFRQECLDRELLYTLSESRVVFNDWRTYYNNERPHRSLGSLTPTQFAKQLNTGSGSVRPTASLRQNLQKQPNQQHNLTTGNLS
ncbi:MAG: integrase core domain-containing protein [Puniceicoccales bacterium]